MAQTMADLLRNEGKGGTPPPPTELGYDFPEEGIPLAYLKPIRQAESNYGIPKNLLPRLFKIESNFNPNAVNPDSGASGIAQIMPKIHPDVDPFNANASIDYAAKYLRDLHDKHGNWEDALASYGGFKDRGKAQGYISKVTGNKSMAAMLQSEGAGDTMADLLRKESGPKINPLLPEYIDRANRSVASYAAVEEMREASDRAARNAAAQPLLGPEPMGPPMPPAPMQAVEFPGESRLEMVPSGGMLGGPSTPFRYTVPGEPGPVMKQVGEFAKGAGEILEAIPGAVAGGAVGGRVGGPIGAVAGAGIGAALHESYQAWKKGDIPALLNIMTFGSIPNAANQLNAAGDELVRGRPTAALAEIAKAVPIFGPMAAAVEDSLRTGQYARAGGEFLATVGLPLAGAALHDRVVPRASVRAAKNIEPIVEEARVKAEEITKEPDPVVQQEKMVALETETKTAVEQVIKDTATAEVIKEEVKVQAAEIKEKKVRKGRTPEQMAEMRAKRKVKVEPEAVTAPPPTTTADVQAEIADQAERARLDEETRQWKREHPEAGRKVKPEEAATKLEAVVEEKPSEPVRSKIDRTKKPEVMVTGEDLAEAEKHFGKALDEIPDEALEDFITARHEKELEPAAAEPARSKVKMSAEELKGLTKKVLEEEKPVEPEPITEPLTEVDTQTGTPEPSVESVFRVDDPEVISNSARAYSKNKMVAGNIEEIFNSDTYKDPSTTYQKLVNDVNRWLHGEEVDIVATREFLSELAARADSFGTENFFPKEYGDGVDISSFNDWKDTVREAASWARKVDRSKIGQTEGAKLYSGLPVDKLADAFKKFMYRVPVGEGKAPEFEPNIGADRIVENGRIAIDAFDKAAAAKGFSIDWAEKKKNFVRAMLDKSGNIREEFLNKLGDRGYDIVQRMSLSKGGPARGTAMFRQMRKEVYSGLSGPEKKTLDRLILYTRILDIASYKKPGKVVFPEGMEPDKAASYLATFQGQEGLTPEKAFELFHTNPDGTTGGRVGAYYEWMKKPLKDMLNAELITQEMYDGLVKHNYRRIGTIDHPTTIAELIDKKYTAVVGNVKRTVSDSGIQTMRHGKTTSIFETSSEIMGLETFNRAYGRVMNNEANRTLYDLALSDPKNEFSRVKKSGKELKALVDDLTNRLTAEGVGAADIEAQVKALKAGEKIPAGWTPNFVYVKGQRRTVFLSPDMAKEWITNTRDISTRAAQWARWVSLSPLTRTFATGVEWSFALANPFRDIAQIWWAARVFEKGKWKSVYSDHMPVFVPEILHDIGTVFNDARLRKGRFIDAANTGGLMDFLVHQARPFSKGLHLEGPVERVYDFLGKFGETSELVTRLAIIERVLRNKANELGIDIEQARADPKILREAVFASRDYMDFATGGWATKAADNALPYLNASIVGMRGFFRAFEPNSGTAIKSYYKLGQVALVIGGLYLASKWKAPKTHRDLRYDTNSQNNLIIPLGDDFGFKDAKGQMRYPYLKIPLDQNLRFFKKLTEASIDKWMGDPVDIEGTANALAQLSPIGISSLPPTAAAGLGYKFNIDTWKAQNIVDKPLNYQFPKWATGKKYGGSEEERTPQTPAIAGAAGTATGMSPERLRYAMRSLIGNSMWGQLIGLGYEKVFSQVPPEQRQQHLAEILAKTPVFSRFIGITNPRAATEGIETDAEQHSIAKRMVEDTGLDARVNGYLYDKSYTKKDVIDYIRSQKDIAVEKRMLEDLEFSTTTKDLPHKGFWLSLRRMPVDARAEAFVGYLNQALPGEKAEIRKEMGRVMMIGKKPDEEPTGGGVFTKDFWMEVGKLQRAGVKYPGLRD